MPSFGYGNDGSHVNTFFRWIIDMNDTLKVIFGIGIPLLGTTLGAAMVFLIKSNLKPNVQKAFLGFASGVMIAASVWSLLIPAIDMTKEAGGVAWLPAVVGFLIGIGFLLLLDTLIPHLHLNSERPEGKSSKLGRPQMLVLAVTLHNIPEGMAVGVVFAGMLSSTGTVITAAGAFALAIGIAIQNFPEGAIISMPLIGSGFSRRRAFRYGFFIRRRGTHRRNYYASSDFPGPPPSFHTSSPLPPER